jgi:hypothetical protein
MLRKTPFLIALIAVVMVISGCKRIKHELDTVYSVEITANEITLKTDGYLFRGLAVLDPNLNEDTKNWDIIKLSLGEARFTVKEANITDMLFSYSLEFKITDDVLGTSITHSYVEMNSLYPENSFLFPSNSANDAFFSNLIHEKHSATIMVSGFASQTGVELVFTFKIMASVGLAK